MQNGKEKYKIWKMKNKRRKGQENWIKNKSKSKKTKKEKKERKKTLNKVEKKIKS